MSRTCCLEPGGHLADRPRCPNARAQVAPRAALQSEPWPLCPCRGERVSEIDWPTELRKIEREFDGLPAEPTPVELRAQFEAERLVAMEYGPGAVAGAWMRLLLVAVLGVAVYVWPYPRACGTGLFAFGAAASVVVVGGVWAAVAAWCRLAARAHVLSLVVLAWGVAL